MKRIHTLIYFILISFYCNAGVGFEKIYQGLGMSTIAGLDQTGDSGFVFCGTKNYDYFIVKVDKYGVVQWTKQIGDSSLYEFCTGIVRSQNNTITFIGETDDYFSDFEVYLYTLDSSGTVLSAVPHPPVDGWKTINPSLDRNSSNYYYWYYLDGYTADNFFLLNDSIYLSGDESVSAYVSINNNDVFYSNAYYPTLHGDSGLVVNANRIKNSFGLDSLYQFDYNANTICSLVDNGAIISGSKGDQTYLYKIDSLGNFVWEKYFSHVNSNSSGIVLRQLADGGFILLSALKDLPGNAIWVLRLDQNADTLWSRTFYGNTVANPIEVRSTYDNGFVILGATGINPYLIKIDSLGNLNIPYEINSVSQFYCFGNTAILALPPADSYLWSNGSTNDSIFVTSTGMYSALVTDSSGTYQTNFFNVFFESAPNVDFLLNDSIIFCDHGTLNDHQPYLATKSYNWYRNDTLLTTHSNSITVTTSGYYKLSVSNICGAGTDSVYVDVRYAPLPIVTYSDFNTCNNHHVTLATNNNGSIYNWNYDRTNYHNVLPIPNSDNDTLIIAQGGYYTVTIDYGNSCIVSSQPAIFIGDYSVATVLTVSGSLLRCQNDSVLVSLTYQWPFYAYLWSDGITSASRFLTAPGDYSVFVQDTIYGCNGTSNTIHFDWSVPPVISLGQDTVLCINSSMILDGGNFSSYLWNDSSTNRFLTVLALSPDTQFYSIVVTDSFGCTALDSIQIISSVCSGVEDQQESELSVFPNPTSSWISIRHNLKNNTAIRILNQFGQVVLEKRLMKNETYSEVDLSEFVNGVYYCAVKDEKKNIEIHTVLIIIH